MTTSDPTPRRLYLFQLASGTMPVGERPVEFSAGCYLVQMGDGKNVLIDSGMPADFELPAMPSLVIKPNVLEQLAALGLHPENIDIVISTHFDIDHAGYHDAFPRAEHVVQRAHYEAARSGTPRFARAQAHWDDPALRYRLVDGDSELLPGLRLIETSGHAPGHQSVLVRLPHTGEVLLAIDAVSRATQFTPDRTATPIGDNEEQLRASTRKLRDLVEREEVSLVVFGHDGEQWQRLKKAPDFYD